MARIFFNDGTSVPVVETIEQVDEILLSLSDKAKFSKQLHRDNSIYFMHYDKDRDNPFERIIINIENITYIV